MKRLRGTRAAEGGLAGRGPLLDFVRLHLGEGENANARNYFCHETGVPSAYAAATISQGVSVIRGGVKIFGEIPAPSSIGRQLPWKRCLDVEQTTK